MLIGIIVLIILFLLDVYFIYISFYFEKKREDTRQKKYSDSIKEVKTELATYSFYTYPDEILISVNGNFANIKTKYIDIKENSEIDELVFDGVKQILNFNIKTSKISFINSNYKEKDGVIFDDKDTVCFIYKIQTIEKLKGLARNYNIKRSALKYFSNASYIQFTNKGILRISHPYNQDENNPKLVCPKKIDGIEVKLLEINYHNVDYLFLNDNIKQVIYEKDSKIRRIDLDKSKYLKIRNGNLVYRKYNLIISCFNDVRKIDKNSPKYYYKPPFIIEKNITFCRIKEE